ncbi:MAG: DUF599 domain-containing protein [Pseudomonadales bacterium]
MSDAGLIGYAYDGAAFTFTGLLIVGYHAYLRLSARRDADVILSHVAIRARTAWVRAMMSDKTNGLLAIQTLRNTTMAATFLASTAILLIVGVLTLSGQATSLQSSWHFLNFFGTVAPQLWLIKLLCLLFTLLFAFFCFSNAIRVLNHVGYMINTQDDTQGGLFSTSQVAAELNRGGRYFSLGIRAYYYLATFVFWLFGPLYLVFAAVILIGFVLPKIDKVPQIKQFK